MAYLVAQARQWERLDKLSSHQARKMSPSRPNSSVKKQLDLGIWTSGNGEIEVGYVVPKVFLRSVWSLGVPKPPRDGTVGCRELRCNGKGSFLLGGGDWPYGNSGGCVPQGRPTLLGDHRHVTSLPLLITTRQNEGEVSFLSYILKEGPTD